MTSAPLTSHSWNLAEEGDPVDDGRAFRRALGQFATGVTVVTTSLDGELYGMTANSFSAVSLDPPLVLWSIRKDSSSRDAFATSGHFVINVLNEPQIEVSGLFARPGEGRFEKASWATGVHGDPLLDDSGAHFECVTENVMDAGDHLILLGRVNRFARYEGAPLLFSQGQYGSFSSHPDLGADGAPEAGAAVDPNGEEALFPTLLRAADRTMSALFDEQRKALGITRLTSRVLNRLAMGARSTEEVRAEAFLGENSVVEALNELADDGLVHQSAEDRWELTGSGVQLRAALRLSAEAFTAEQLREIPPADLGAARRVLMALAER